MRENLTARLLELGGAQKKLCLAFSGGSDSALLLRLACDAGLIVTAVTFDSTLQPAGETRRAEQQARECGAMHFVLSLDPLADERVRQNSRDRCYHCKHALFSALCAYAQAHDAGVVLDGTNADDLGEYRPGLRALGELGISSPLAELGIGKAQVRALSAQMGLATADKPSSPCLATRFPYDMPLESAALMRVSAAEETLHRRGFAVVRVRAHGLLARVELPPARFGDFLTVAPEIDSELKRLGFAQVTLDLAGFRSGSFDQ